MGEVILEKIVAGKFHASYSLGVVLLNLLRNLCPYDASFPVLCLDHAVNNIL